MKGWHLHLDNAAVGADIQNLSAKLMSEVGDGLQVLVLVSQRLTGGQLARVEVLGGVGKRSVNGLMGVVDIGVTSSNLAVVSQELLKVLGSENVDLGEQKLTLDKGGVGVIQNSPDWDEILQLSPGLLDNAVLTSQHNGHARKILHLGVAHNKRVNVEATGGKNSGDTGQDSGLVLNQAVEDVTLRGSGGGSRGVVEDVGDGGLGGPCWGVLADRQWRRTTSKSLVGDGRGRAARGAISSCSQIACGGAPGASHQGPERGHLVFNGENNGFPSQTRSFSGTIDDDYKVMNRL